MTYSRDSQGYNKQSNSPLLCLPSSQLAHRDLVLSSTTIRLNRRYKAIEVSTTNKEMQSSKRNTHSVCIKQSNNSETHHAAQPSSPATVAGLSFRCALLNQRNKVNTK